MVQMPNLASVLKSEIARIARKEAKSRTDTLKKTATQFRTHIASLKRQVSALEALLKKQAKTGGNSIREPADAGGEDDAKGLRFRAKGFAAHRQRLGLSAAQAAALLGVSALTIYHWEAGKSRPRAKHMPRISAFRKLGKKRAIAAVEQVLG